MNMRYATVCSGIGCSTIAWRPLGWQLQWFAEIEPFASALLAQHYPEVPNHGDFTAITADAGPIDLLEGGTPCQSFSVAGDRGGLDDARGNLALEFVELAHRVRARWVVWENVPGILSSGGGRDFGAIIRALAERGYGFAYRVLDAKYFGVPQRRRRVFVVGHSGDWRAPAAVLFERESLSWATATCGEAGDGDTGALECGVGGGREVARCLTARNQRLDYATETLVVGTLMASGAGTGHVASCGSELSFVIPSNDGNFVRRLTPRECERLMGLPDDYTAISYQGKPAADTPRYRAIGNGQAVPVMRWIGERIAQYEWLMEAERNEQ